MPPRREAGDATPPLDALKSILRGKVVLVGVGNTLRGDDGFGPALADELHPSQCLAVINAGPTPENHTGTIIRETPDTIIFADAADIGMPPGHWALLKKNELLDIGFTTHDISPTLLIEFIEAQTPAPVYLLAVQPKSLQMGQPLSPAVRAAVNALVAAIDGWANP